MAYVDDLIKKYQAANPNETAASRMMRLQMGSLNAETDSNFHSIINKYPNMSTDLVFSMVRQGLTVDTPGIGKITSVDGIAGLKNDALNLDKIKKTQKPPGILGAVGSTIQHALYEPLKGTTRVLFSGLKSAYQFGTTVARDAVAMSRGESGAGGQFVQDLQQSILGETTELGQMLRSGNNGTGSGFFVTPKSKVGKAQELAMAKYGKVNGESFTIGRGLFNGMGMNPESNAYHIMSGIVDATLNVAADPSTWFGPGAVGKLITGGKKLTEAEKLVALQSKATMDTMLKEGITDLEKQGLVIKDKISKRISSPFRRVANNFKSKELEIVSAENKIVSKQVRTATTLINSEKKWFAFEAQDSAVKATLSPKRISEWFVTNPKAKTGELVDALGLLSADMKNTAGFFDGHIILDEIPQYGAISIGAHGLDEYAVTANSAKKLNLLDMANTFKGASEDAIQKEQILRSKFADELSKLGKDISQPENRVFNELSDQLKKETGNLEGFIGSLFSVADELVPVKSLGSLIGEVALQDNPIVMSKISDLVQKIWKVDGFSNIRSIYGKLGGFAITKGERIAATRADIGMAAAEWANPTALGLNVAKLMESIKTGANAIAERQNELDELLNKQIDLKDKENWFSLLREKAHGDPEILKELIQDPENVGIKGLLKLELELAENTLHKESIQAMVGVTDNFMGDIGKDFSKPLQYILGKNFRPIAELIAKETDPVRLRNLFNRKLDDAVIKELTAADNVDDVLKVFLNQLTPGGSARKISESLSTGLKIATNPVARMVPGISQKAIKYSENINRAVGREYIREKVLTLNDVTRLNTGFEDWMSSIGIRRILKGSQQSIIESTQKAIFNATTNSERSAAVANGISTMMEQVGKTLNLTKEQIDELKTAAKITGNDEPLLRNYALEQTINNSGKATITLPNSTVELDGAIHESQLANGVIHLPSTKKINETIVGYKTNVPIFGQARSLKILLNETNDLWRTAQLVFRVSYVIRNIAEMQTRQFLSGHMSLFNNPLGFISMMIANPDGNMFQKALAKRSQYGVNALGEYWKSADGEVEFSQSVIARRAVANRNNLSVSDYGGTGRSRDVFKLYQVVGSEHPDFQKALAWTINNYSNDSLFPDVINILGKGSQQEVEFAKTQYIDNLINTFDEPDNKLREFVSSIYEDNMGLRKVFLINPFKETGPGVVKENISRENLAIYLFDASQPNSVAGTINTIAGQGAHRNLILDLIRNGEVSVPSKGKAIKIKTPYRQKGLTTEQVLEAEKTFEKQVATIFTPDGMVGSSARLVTEKFGKTSFTSTYKKWGDTFFKVASIGESKFNFGPEFDASYWDFIAGYADMLTTDELKQLSVNARKAFNPTGLPMIKRKAKPLREIENVLKKRRDNPDYIHVGGTSLKTIDRMASEEATDYVKNLFYDAAKQKQWANAARLVFPFAQAQYNTIGKWAELSKSNPVPIHNFAKAFDALTRPGTNVMYDATGTTYDDQQGFLYRDSVNQQLRFKMPLMGSLIGAFAGQGIHGKDMLQITSPVEGLNLAFGAVNPVIPGVGAVGTGLYIASGKAQAFGPIDDILRDIITPFGAAKTPTDIIFPAWLKKTSAALLGDDASTQRGVKDWASQLASTGKYGTNPLANDQERNRLFNDAERLSKSMNLVTGFFQSLIPSPPTQEILLKIKNPNNKMNFMTITMLYKEWKDLQNKYPGDYAAVVGKFAEKFGVQNLLVAVSGTTPGTSGTEDSWAFLNKHSDTVDKYAQPNSDVMPYFFPGGDFSFKYYNWQKRTGARTSMSTSDISLEAEGMVYSMLKDQIVKTAFGLGYGDMWINEQVALLDKQFTAKPIEKVVTGVADNKIAVIGKALQDPIMQESSVYKQISEFYPKFQEFSAQLNKVKASNYAELSSKGGVATLMRNELIALGEKLIGENPEFSRMYYGVFANILKETK